MSYDPQLLFRYLLRVADDHLILAQRLGELTGHAPTLEEELSLANVALDLLGQARTLYTYAGDVEGRGRGEDEIAMLRLESEYVNALLVEQPNDDFAYVMMRQLFFSAHATHFWQSAVSSADRTLAGAAAQGAKESAYHLRYAREWVIRLGDGTEESHRHAVAALTDLWPYTGELFERDETVAQLVDAGVAPDPDRLRPSWQEVIISTLREATLPVPDDNWMQTGGRAGRHTEHLGHLLCALQYMQRTYPEMSW